MSVYCQQIVNGELLDPEFEVEPPQPGMTDEEVLAVKAASGSDKGWDVEWLSPTELVLRKVRWAPDTLCERVLRIG